MRPLKPLTVLRRLRKLFSDKTRWTRGKPARDDEGRSVHPRSTTAVCWCLSGGYDKFDPEDKSGAFCLIEKQAVPVSPVYLNDYQGYEAVLALLDRTIAAERAKGGT